MSLVRLLSDEANAFLAHGDSEAAVGRLEHDPELSLQLSDVVGSDRNVRCHRVSFFSEGPTLFAEGTVCQVLELSFRR